MAFINEPHDAATPDRMATHAATPDRMATHAGSQALHEATVRITHLQRNQFQRVQGQRSSNRISTKELIGFLLGHGARAWRLSLPPAKPRVKASTPHGTLAVRISFNARPGKPNR